MVLFVTKSAIIISRFTSLIGGYMQYLSRLFETTSEVLILYLIVFLAILFLSFLLVREFWCWYLKTTKITYLLEEISEKISEQNKLQSKIFNYMMKNNSIKSEEKEKSEGLVDDKSNNTFETGWKYIKNEESGEG